MHGHDWDVPFFSPRWITSVVSHGRTTSYFKYSVDKDLKMEDIHTSTIPMVKWEDCFILCLFALSPLWTKKIKPTKKQKTGPFSRHLQTPRGSQDLFPFFWSGSLSVNDGSWETGGEKWSEERVETVLGGGARGVGSYIHTSRPDKGGKQAPWESSGGGVMGVGGCCNSLVLPRCRNNVCWFIYFTTWFNGHTHTSPPRFGHKTTTTTTNEWKKNASRQSPWTLRCRGVRQNRRCSTQAAKASTQACGVLSEKPSAPQHNQSNGIKSLSHDSVFFLPSTAWKLWTCAVFFRQEMSLTAEGSFFSSSFFCFSFKLTTHTREGKKITALDTLNGTPLRPPAS